MSTNHYAISPPVAGVYGGNSNWTCRMVVTAQETEIKRGAIMSTNHTPHTVSDFRRAMAARGIALTFGEAAECLIEAGICERVNDGVALVHQRVAECDRLRAVNAELRAALQGFEQAITHHVSTTIGPNGEDSWPIVAEAVIAARAALAQS